MARAAVEVKPGADAAFVFRGRVPAQPLTKAQLAAKAAESESANARSRAAGNASARRFTGESVSAFGEFA